MGSRLTFYKKYFTNSLDSVDYVGKHDLFFNWFPKFSKIVHILCKFLLMFTSANAFTKSPRNFQ